MHVFLKFIIRWFGDENDELHGWRLVAGFSLFFLPLFWIAAIPLGWSQGLRFAACMTVVGLLAALVLWFLDWVRCQRREAKRRLGDFIGQKDLNQRRVSPGRRRAMKLAATIMVLLACLAIAIQLIIGVQRDFASTRWPATPGWCERSHVSVSEGGRHVVKVNMTYKVNGIEHVKWLDATPLNERLSREEAEWWARYFGPRTSHRVWYDPSNPARAKLLPGADWFKYWSNAPGLFLLVGLIGGSIYGLIKLLRTPVLHVIPDCCPTEVMVDVDWDDEDENAAGDGQPLERAA